MLLVNLSKNFFSPSRCLPDHLRPSSFGIAKVVRFSLPPKLFSLFFQKSCVNFIIILLPVYYKTKFHHPKSIFNIILHSKTIFKQPLDVIFSFRPSQKSQDPPLPTFLPSKECAKFLLKKNKLDPLYLYIIYMGTVNE